MTFTKKMVQKKMSAAIVNVKKNCIVMQYIDFHLRITVIGFLGPREVLKMGKIV